MRQPIPQNGDNFLSYQQNTLNFPYPTLLKIHIQKLLNPEDVKNLMVTFLSKDRSVVKYSREVAQIHKLTKTDLRRAKHTLQGGGKYLPVYIKFTFISTIV